jgi:hypothetical protein
MKGLINIINNRLNFYYLAVRYSKFCSLEPVCNQIIKNHDQYYVQFEIAKTDLLIFINLIFLVFKKNNFYLK